MKSGFGASRLIDCMAAIASAGRQAVEGAHDERGEAEQDATDEAGADGGADGEGAGERRSWLQ